MKSFLSKAAKIFAIALGIPVLLVLLVLFALHLPPVLERVVEWGEGFVSETIQGDLRVESLEGSVFGKLTAREVALIDEEGNRVVSARQVEIEPALMALLHGTVSLDIHADGIVAYLERGEEGSLNIAEMFVSEQPSSGPSLVSVDVDITASDGSILWRDISADTHHEPLDDLGSDYAREALRDAAGKVKTPEEITRALPHSASIHDLELALQIHVERDSTTYIQIEKVEGMATVSDVTGTRGLSANGVTITVEEQRTSGSITALALHEWLTVADFQGWASTTDATAFAVHAGLVEISEDAARRALPELDPRGALQAAAHVTADRQDLKGWVRIKPELSKGDLAVAATISSWSNPGPTTRYDVSLAARDFEAARALGAAEPVDEVSVWAELRGSGIDLETMQAEAHVAVRDLRASGYHLSVAYIDATAAEGTWNVDRGLVASPYVSAALRGHYTENGLFGLHLHAKSTDAMAGFAQKVLGRKLDSRADVRLDANGELDLAAENPLDVVRKLQADATWEIARFEMEDIYLRGSSGKLEASVTPAGGSREVSWDIDADADSFRAADSSLSSAEVRTTGSTRIGSSSIDARQVLGALRTDTRVKVAGLDAVGNEIGDGDLRVKVAPSDGRLRWELDVSADRYQSSALSSRSIAAQLRGDVTLGPTLAWPGAVRALSVKGSLAAGGADTGTQKAGRLDATIDIAGPVKDLRGTVSADATDLAAGGFDFTTLSADVQFVGNRQFVIDAQGTQREDVPQEIGLTVTGQYAPDLLDYTITDLRLTTGEADGWEMGGEFRADVKEGVFEFRDLTLTKPAADGTTQRVRVDGTYRSGVDQDLQAELENLKLGELASQFGVTGLEDFSATADGSVALGGTHDDPTSTFDIVLSDVMWQEWGPFTIALQGSYDQELLRLQKGVVTGYDLELLNAVAEIPVDVDASFNVEFLRRRNLSATLTVPEFPISALSRPLPDLADMDLGGTAKAVAELRGQVDAPVLRTVVDIEDVTASGEAQGAPYDFGPATSNIELSYFPSARADSGLFFRGALAFQKEKPFEAKARVRAPIADWIREMLEGATVDWASRLENAPVSFSASAEKFDLRNLRVGPLQRADVEGFIDLELEGEGTVSQPDAEIRLGLDDFGWDRYRDIYLDLDASLSRELAEVRSVTLEWDASPILEARGRLPTPFAIIFGNTDIAAVPLDFTAQLMPLPLRKFSAVDYGFANLRGEIQGYLEAGGTMAAPVIDSRVSINDFEFQDKSRGTVAIEIDASDNRANADVRICHGPDAVLEAVASLPVQLDLARWMQSEEPVETFLDGEISGRLLGNDVNVGGLLPREILEDWVQEVDGELDVDLELSGTFEQPVVVGALQVRNGEMFLTGFSRFFRDIQVDLAIDRQGLVDVKTLYLRDERGYAKADGTLRMNGFEPGEIDLAAQLRSLSIAGFADITAFVSADVDATGNLSGTSADARALVSKLEVVIPETSSTTLHPTSLDSDIVIVKNKRRSSDLFTFDDAAAAASRRPYARMVVEIEPNSWIRHPFAEVEIKGEVDVELLSSGALLGGDIRTVRGEAEVFGRRFVIEEGIVTFTGANPPNPLLQIEARYSYDRNVASALGTASDGEPHAIVRVTGRTDDPQIRFYSDPELPEEDVIYTLLTNRPPNEAEVGQSGASDIAAGAASGLAATFLEDQLAQVVPGFNVRVEAGDEGFADPTFEVGRYVGPFFFSIEAKVGADANENAAELNIEYRLSRRWLIEVEAGTRGAGETNIFWDIY